MQGERHYILWLSGNSLQVWPQIGKELFLKLEVPVSGCMTRFDLPLSLGHFKVEHSLNGFCNILLLDTDASQTPVNI